MHEIWGGIPTKTQLSVLVEYKAGIYIISSKGDLFSL